MGGGRELKAQTPLLRLWTLGNSNNLASYEIRWAIRRCELFVITEPDYHGQDSEYNNGPAGTVEEPAVWEKYDPLLLSGEPSQFCHRNL